MDFFAAVSSSTRGIAVTAAVSAAIAISLPYVEQLSSQCSSLKPAQASQKDLVRCMLEGKNAPSTPFCSKVNESYVPDSFNQTNATDPCQGCKFGSSPTPGELMCGFAPNGVHGKNPFCCPIAAHLTKQSVANLSSNCFCFTDQLQLYSAADDVLGASRTILHKDVLFHWVYLLVAAGILAVSADAVILWRGIRQRVVMAGFCGQDAVLRDSWCCCCASHHDVAKAQRRARLCHTAVVGLCNLSLIAGTAWFWSIWTFGGCIQDDAGSIQVAQTSDPACFTHLLTAILFVGFGIVVRSLVGLWFRYKTSDEYCDAADLREAKKCIAMTSMYTPGSRVGYATACLSEMAESAATADRMEWKTDTRKWRLNSEYRKLFMQLWTKLFLLGDVPQCVEDADTKCSAESKVEDSDKLDAWVDLMHWMCQAMGLEHAAVVFNRHNLLALSRGPSRDYPGGKQAAKVVSEGMDVIFGRSAEGAIRYPWHANWPRRKFFYVPQPHRTLARLDKTIQECELMDDRIQWKQPPGGTVNHASLLVVVAICLHSKRDLTEKFREKFEGTLNLNWPDEMLTREALSNRVRSDNFLDTLAPRGPAADAAAGAAADAAAE